MATHSSPVDWADTNFARRSFLTANAVELASTVSDLPARFRLPRAADYPGGQSTPGYIDVLGNTIADTRRDCVFYSTAGELLKWEFTNTTSGVGFLKWPTLTALSKTDQILCYYDYAGASSQQSSGSDIYGATCEGFWSMDEGTGVGAGAVTDRSGNANHGTPTNMEEGDWVAGPLTNDYALECDGTNEHILVGDAASIDIGTSDFTLMAMVKSAVGDSGARRIFNKRVGTVGYEMYLENGDDTLRFLIGDPNGFSADDLGTVSVRDAAWHHVAVTFDRSGWALGYVDGAVGSKELDIASRSGSIANNQDLRFGAYGDEAKAWNGLLGSGGIFSSALSASEIAAHNLSLTNELYSWGPEETQ